MTKEEKQLLLKELCARLLYGVKGRYCLYDSKGNLTDFGNEPEIVENIDLQKEKYGLMVQYKATTLMNSKYISVQWIL